MRREPGAFLPEQLDLARLFSVRAAAVIEMARLYDQTRGDADAKAILLRELNHRVKNNLASIVSLLSINQPELLPDARQWLNRCIDRISAMAQVHDLYSGAPRRVSLAELIDRTVQSLSVVKPPEVVVMTDLPSRGPWLRTDRAVSLSMAIHELCFNGIVHGLGQQGTLTIRAACRDGQLITAVEDDAGRTVDAAAARTGSPQAPGNASPRVARGTTSPAERPVPGGSGIGLSLVRGLVGRELHGQFTIAAAPGGTLATLQFPLLPDEMRDTVV
jgi:two-component sensor histidine kinase